MDQIPEGSISSDYNMFSFQVAFDHFYNPGAAADQCTLFSDRNLINRRNVVEDVKKKFSACKQLTWRLRQELLQLH